MELTIKKSEIIKVIPECLKGEDKPPTFLFREPNANDVLTFMSLKDINKTINDCFVGFENKIELKASNGDVLNYTTYQELINSGYNQVLVEIHAECVIKMSEVLEKIAKEGKKTEKKSK